MLASAQHIKQRRWMMRRIVAVCMAAGFGGAGVWAVFMFAGPIQAKPLDQQATPQANAQLFSRDLNPAPASILVGESAGISFGSFVASAADVNGDGFDDLVVGAYGYLSDTGRVYVYHGESQGLNEVAAITLTGEAPANFFGRSAASFGDINGDGYADLVVGAYGYDAFTGRVYVYQGGPHGLVPAPILTITGESEYSWFGRWVANAGDVNGNGHEDLIVGASGYNNDQGRAYVFPGNGSGFETTSVLTLTGESVGDWFGLPVATAGDVNADGYDDVVIGAHRAASQAGRAYVYHGSALGLNSTPALTLSTESPGDWFGNAAATAGDVNGDGFADLIIGAPANPVNGPGRAFLYYGSHQGISATSVVTLSGENARNAFGRAVASAQDVNGDGYADLIVGANGYNNNRGRAYLYYGGQLGLNTTPALTLTGTSVSENFGHAIAAAGDLDGNGYSGLAIGGEGFDNRTGRVFVYLHEPLKLYLPMILRLGDKFQLYLPVTIR
jgi:hypothetical protein